MSPEHSAFFLEDAQVLSNRDLGDREPLGQIGDSHPAMFFDAASDVLLALACENLPAIARFHRARLSFGDAVHADHYVEVLSDVETVDEKQSNCQRVD